MLELWYHDDLDGVVSGAMLASGLELSVVAKPVQYGDVLPTPGPMLAVVDFQFHPGATYWVDHHATAFVAPEHEQQVTVGQHPWWVYDPTAPSCAQLLGDTLRARGMYPSTMSTWEALATRVDTAAYTSPDDYILLTDPAAALAQVYGELSPSDKNFLFRALPYASPETILTRYQPQVQELRKSNMVGLNTFERQASHTNGIVHADLAGSGTPWVRFSGFALYPKADLAVTLMTRGPHYVLTLSGNPWTGVPVPHLGQLIRTHAPTGGGHARAAGASFTTYQEALNAYWTIIRTVNV